ncbi:MAG: hypothetical protein AAF223_19855, partial [Bacteroidota bacterium]
GAQTQIDVILAEDAAQLNEVIVVGYSTQRKSDLTGAVAQIKEMKLKSILSVMLPKLCKGAWRV